MKRLFVLTMLIIMIFTLLCTALIGIARAQPLTPIPLLDEITDCGGQLCFRGVILGKTDASDVKTLLGNYPDTQVDDIELIDSMIEQVNVVTSHGTIQFWSNDNQQAERSKMDVMNIMLAHYPRLTFLDLVAHFGSPCKVALSDKIGIHIFYRWMEFDVDMVRPNFQIFGITSINDPKVCLFNDSYIEKHWRGWRSRFN
jgi:hypothetical protein